MAEKMMLKIRQQPFDPPFVIEMDGEERPARVGKLENGHILAQIEGDGTYAIDVSDVGFFFVEREAVPAEHAAGSKHLGFGAVSRLSRHAAKLVGEHFGDVLGEFQTVRSAVLPRISR